MRPSAVRARLAAGALGISVMLSALLGTPAHASDLPASQDNAGQSDPVGAIYAAAANHNADANILINIVRLESNFNPYAVGDYGASVGLIQLHRNGLRGHFYAVGYTDPYSVEQCVDYLARVATGEWRGQGVGLFHWTAARLLGYAY